MRLVILLALILIFGAGVLPVFLETSPSLDPLPANTQNDESLPLFSDKYVPVPLIERLVFESTEVVTKVTNPTKNSIKPESFRLTLVGVTLASPGRNAIFTSSDGREKVTLSVGDSHAGWVLEEVSASQVLLSHEGQSTRFQLFVSGTQGKN